MCSVVGVTSHRWVRNRAPRSSNETAPYIACLSVFTRFHMHFDDSGAPGQGQIGGHRGESWRRKPAKLFMGFGASFSACRIHSSNRYPRW
ncbi:hypothetical protein FB563_6332 [Streptomyces puniciscabiei]|uniref:Uncharacterized protein n=2 Tax=Streptomyces puniciscabiei TaxID=164348 RepID=A0A542THA4_9ACTN|nr:hypothetical protein FB563_6332 [Streptomyces puniciscabiei]